MANWMRLSGCLMLVSALSLAACSDDEDDGGGTSGSAGAGTGGASGASTGGSSGGGQGGSSGAATGGSAGASSGGSAGSAGSSTGGSAGGSGAAGAAGGDAAAPVAEVVDCATVTPDATVTIQGAVGLQSFNPGNVTVNVNDVVRWVNDTATAHTVTSGVATDTNLWPEINIATKAQNGEGCIKFLAADSYQYHCSVHPTMLGTVTVQ